MNVRDWFSFLLGGSSRQAVGELKDLPKGDHISAGQQRQEESGNMAGMFKYEEQLWSTEMNKEEGSGLATEARSCPSESGRTWTNPT